MSIAQSIFNIDLANETHYRKIFEVINNEFEKELVTIIES
jgi:hypothetical protein